MRGCTTAMLTVALGVHHPSRVLCLIHCVLSCVCGGSVSFLGSNSVPRVLVGNQIDLVDDREVSYEAGEDLAAELNCPFVECSALTGQNVTDVFHSLLRAIDGQMMPAEEVVAEPEDDSQPQGQLGGQNHVHCAIS